MGQIRGDAHQARKFYHQPVPPPTEAYLPRPETIRAAIAATRHALMMSTDKAEEQRIEARLALLENALRRAQ